MNSRLRNSVGGTSGSSRVQHAVDERAASDDRDRAAGENPPSVQPRGPASVNAHVPRRGSPPPGRRRRGRGRAPRAVHASRARRRGAHRRRAATGTLMRNAHRQPGPSTSQPPTNGPIAPATPPKPGPGTDRRGPVVLAEAGLQDRQAAGREQRRADALQHARADEHLDVRRRTAQQRRTGEPERADDEDLRRP